MPTPHNRRVAVIGLGYVGLPVAVAFGKSGVPTVGFDVNPKRIDELERGFDHTHEVDRNELAAARLRLGSNPDVLRDSDFYIVAVPTPVDSSRRPDLTALLCASRTVGTVLKRGDVVVYESTVYPGATEEDCVPILESTSGLTCGRDFTVGYSPERINPGDKKHTFEAITKVVSGQDEATLDIVANVYGSVVKAGVFRASSIRVAEMAKVIENTQRDLNIAFMNELSGICHALGIDTGDVLTAASTKWNFLPFSPGLVGGHCIGVDPYYLTHQAVRAGYHPEIILSGRRINDAAGFRIARECARLLVRQGNELPARIAMLGLAFKENVPDIRNSKAVDVIRELENFGMVVQVADPHARPEEALQEYGITLTPLEDIEPADAVILAVPHDAYIDQGWELISRLLAREDGLVVDIKCKLDRKTQPSNIRLWRL